MRCVWGKRGRIGAPFVSRNGPRAPQPSGSLSLPRRGAILKAPPVGYAMLWIEGSALRRVEGDSLASRAIPLSMRHRVRPKPPRPALWHVWAVAFALTGVALLGCQKSRHVEAEGRTQVVLWSGWTG